MKSSLLPGSLVLMLSAITLSCGEMKDSVSAAPVRPAASEPKPLDSVYVATELMCGDKNLFRSKPGYRSAKLIINANAKSGSWYFIRNSDSQTVCHNQFSFSVIASESGTLQLQPQSSAENCAGAVLNRDLKPISNASATAYSYTWLSSDTLKLTFTNQLELDANICPSGSTVQLTMTPYIGASKP